jgi:protein-L-isoaspartate(D-aspartate) O-methyltransferase
LFAGELPDNNVGVMRTNGELVESLVRRRVLKSPQLITAFEKADRVLFVPKSFERQAYYDGPLPIGFDQTISQPTTVAMMLEMLQPQKGQKILDIGTGSGWTTALLAAVVGKDGRVVGTERIPGLVEMGRKNLSKLELPQAEILQADERLGWAQEAQYDRILVSASADQMPESLFWQLKMGGKMVVPVQNSIFTVQKTLAGIIQREQAGFAFVPLRFAPGAA